MSLRPVPSPLLPGSSGFERFGGGAPGPKAEESGSVAAESVLCSDDPLDPTGTKLEERNPPTISVGLRGFADEG